MEEPEIIKKMTTPQKKETFVFGTHPLLRTHHAIKRGDLFLPPCKIPFASLTASAVKDTWCQVLYHVLGASMKLKHLSTALFRIASSEWRRVGQHNRQHKNNNHLQSMTGVYPDRVLLAVLIAERLWQWIILESLVPSSVEYARFNQLVTIYFFIVLIFMVRTSSLVTLWENIAPDVFESLGSEFRSVPLGDCGCGGSNLSTKIED